MKNFLSTLLLLCLITTVCFSSNYLKRARIQSPEGYAIAYKSPAAQEEAFRIMNGKDIKVLAESSGYSKIITLKNNIGWIESGNLEILDKSYKNEYEKIIDSVNREIQKNKSPSLNAGLKISYLLPGLQGNNAKCDWAPGGGLDLYFKWSSSMYLKTGACYQPITLPIQISDDRTSEIKMNFLEIPLLFFARYNIGGFDLNADFGVSFNLLLSHDYEKYDDNDDTDFLKADLGGVLALGIPIKNFTIGGRIYYGLSDISTSDNDIEDKLINLSIFVSFNFLSF